MGLRASVALVGLTLALVPVGCGGGGKAPRDVSASTSTVAPGPGPATTPPDPNATTAAPPASEARDCAAILADGVQLARDFDNADHGIAGADEATYRARAQILVDEAEGRGCPVPPAVKELLAGS